MTEQNYIECKTCKSETTLDLFEKKENWKTIKETLTLLGFSTENPETQTQFKDMVKGYCAVCGEVKILRETIIKKLKPEGPFLNALDNLIDLAKESQWRRDKNALMNTMFSEKLHSKTAWRLYVVLQNIEGQTRELQDWEKWLIHLLRKEFDYSLNTIAYILDRSKDSVHRYSGDAQL